jgi:hypothetical protein
MIEIGGGITIGPGISIGPVFAAIADFVTQDDNNLIAENGDQFITEYAE